jgi:hypothetical protein
MNKDKTALYKAIQFVLKVQSQELTLEETKTLIMNLGIEIAKERKILI